MNKECPEPGKRHRVFLFLGVVLEHEFDQLILLEGAKGILETLAID